MMSGMRLCFSCSAICCCQRLSCDSSMTVGTLLERALWCLMLGWWRCSRDFLKNQEPRRVLGGVGFIGVGVCDSESSPALLDRFDSLMASQHRPTSCPSARSTSAASPSLSTGDIRSSKTTLSGNWALCSTIKLQFFFLSFSFL